MSVTHKQNRFALWLFEHRIGSLYKEYRKLFGQVDRMIFLTENFGKDAIEILEKLEEDNHGRTTAIK